MRKPGKLGREKASDDDGDLLDDDGELLDGGDQQTPRSGKKTAKAVNVMRRYLTVLSI